MNKNIGDMTEEELKDFIIELQEENSRYERRINKALNKINNMFDRGDGNMIIDDLLFCIINVTQIFLFSF